MTSATKPIGTYERLAAEVFDNGGVLLAGIDRGVYLDFPRNTTVAQEIRPSDLEGLAIQVEKPFRVGQWIAVASYEGQVTEITWRATRLRTKTGDTGVLAPVAMRPSTIARASSAIDALARHVAESLASISPAMVAAE